MTKTNAQLTADVTRLEQQDRRLEAQMRRSGGGAGGVGGFQIDADGNLILTYAGSPPNISIAATGHLILEI